MFRKNYARAGSLAALVLAVSGCSGVEQRVLDDLDAGIPTDADTTQDADQDSIYDADTAVDADVTDRDGDILPEADIETDTDTDADTDAGPLCGPFPVDDYCASGWFPISIGQDLYGAMGGGLDSTDFSCALDDLTYSNAVSTASARRSIFFYPYGEGVDPEDTRDWFTGTMVEGVAADGTFGTWLHFRDGRRILKWVLEMEGDYESRVAADGTLADFLDTDLYVAGKRYTVFDMGLLGSTIDATLARMASEGTVGQDAPLVFGHTTRGVDDYDCVPYDVELRGVRDEGGDLVADVSVNGESVSLGSREMDRLADGRYFLVRDVYDDADGTAHVDFMIADEVLEHSGPYGEGFDLRGRAFQLNGEMLEGSGLKIEGQAYDAGGESRFRLGSVFCNVWMDSGTGDSAYVPADGSGLEHFLDEPQVMMNMDAVFWQEPGTEDHVVYLVRRTAE